MGLRVVTRRNIIYGDELMAEFTHFDGDGNAHMVDVGSKPATARRAIVKGHVKMAPATLKMICDGTAKKRQCFGRCKIGWYYGRQTDSRFDPAVPSNGP